MVERTPACLRYTNRILTIALREEADSDCPVKRAATWPRPSREPGALPRLPRLPPVALAALVAWRSTLETKASPRCFGAPGRMRKRSASSSPRWLMRWLRRSPARSRVRGTRFRQCPRGIGAARGTVPRYGACRADPTCRLALCAPWCRTLQSCPASPPGPTARGCDAPAALRNAQLGRRRAPAMPAAWRARGKRSARGNAARCAVRMHTRNAGMNAKAACGTAQGCAPSRLRLQTDRLRDADHGGCADRPEIPVVERRRVGGAEQEQFAPGELATLRPGW